MQICSILTVLCFSLSIQADTGRNCIALMHVYNGTTAVKHSRVAECSIAIYEAFGEWRYSERQPPIERQDHELTNTIEATAGVPDSLVVESVTLTANTIPSASSAAKVCMLAWTRILRLPMRSII